MCVCVYIISSDKSSPCLHVLVKWSVFLQPCQDMQDIEFTIQQGKLYMLQTRTGKRTAHAAVQIAVDLAQEGFSPWAQLFDATTNRFDW